MSSSLPPLWQHIEQTLHFDHSFIEAGVEEGKDLYRGLDSRALYTSYEDLYQIFCAEEVRGNWIDLGGGTGHTALMYALLFPERQGIAIEASFARISAGLKEKKRLNIQNAELIHADLRHCPLPDGDTYFLYFPTGPVLDRILYELCAKKHSFHLVAIESHGDLLPRLMKEAWLSPVRSIPLSSARHHPEAILFAKKEVSLSQGPHQLSFGQKILLIEEEDYQWLGESLNLEWLKDNQYQLATPPRTIRWEQVKEILEWEDLPQHWCTALKLRQLGELIIHLRTGTLKGHIRKIQVTPCFKLEISTGAWVEWSEIIRIFDGEKICFERSCP